MSTSILTTLCYLAIFVVNSESISLGGLKLLYLTYLPLVAFHLSNLSLKKLKLLFSLKICILN